MVAGGIGPAEAAAATAFELGRGSYDLVISAGIAGGFSPLMPGDVAIASSVVYADLGAETADGFAPLSSIGFNSQQYQVDGAIAQQLTTQLDAHGVDARLGPILTVSMITGTATTAAALRSRHPAAIAEAMEGAGVAASARWYKVPFVEVRTISNVVGPRDRDGWQIGKALDALGRAFAIIFNPNAEAPNPQASSPQAPNLKTSHPARKMEP